MHAHTYINAHVHRLMHTCIDAQTTRAHECTYVHNTYKLMHTLNTYSYTCTHKKSYAHSGRRLFLGSVGKA